MRYVSTRTYADTYSVTTSTVRKWIAAGLVTAIKVNARVIRILDTPPASKADTRAQTAA